MSFKVSKKTILMVLVGLIAMTATFADSNSSDAFGLNTNVSMILELFSSPWVKGIACLALIIEAIGLITAGRSEPGMWKKFVPWIAGTIVFMAAATITGKFLNVSSNTFTNQLNIDSK